MRVDPGQECSRVTLMTLVAVLTKCGLQSSCLSFSGMEP